MNGIIVPKSPKKSFAEHIQQLWKFTLVVGLPALVVIALTVSLVEMPKLAQKLNKIDADADAALKRSGAIDNKLEEAEKKVGKTESRNTEANNKLDVIIRAANVLDGKPEEVKKVLSAIGENPTTAGLLLELKNVKAEVQELREKQTRLQSGRITTKDPEAPRDWTQAADDSGSNVSKIIPVKFEFAAPPRVVVAFDEILGQTGKLVRIKGEVMDDVTKHGCRIKVTAVDGGHVEYVGLRWIAFTE